MRLVKCICLPLIRIQTKGGCRQKSVMIHARCGWTLPCLQKDRLGLNSIFETSVERWAAKKYCFCTGAKRKAQSRLKRKWLVYLPLPHNHIQRERHTARVLIFPCSLFSFPSWWVENVALENVCFFMYAALLWVFLNVYTYGILLFWAFPLELLSTCSTHKWMQCHLGVSSSTLGPCSCSHYSWVLILSAS